MVARTLSGSVARRPRAFVSVSGPEAEDYLQRMVSNDVASLETGGSCDALLLTPKARVIAPLRIWRRGTDDFLLLTEPELGARVRDELQRMRFAANCEIALEQHDSYVLFGVGDGIPNPDYGVEAVEILGELPAELPELGDEELEGLRIEAGTPRYGAEIDERIMPAEAGLDQTHVSFTKGCYPGQEPVARLHYRGRPNWRLRVLEVDGASAGDEIVHDGKAVGRVTSAVPGRALGYVRREVPDDAVLQIGGAEARLFVGKSPAASRP